jgi:hypothetical protein
MSSAPEKNVYSIEHREKLSIAWRRGGTCVKEAKADREDLIEDARDRLNQWFVAK